MPIKERYPYMTECRAVWHLLEDRIRTMDEERRVNK